MRFADKRIDEALIKILNGAVVKQRAKRSSFDNWIEVAAAARTLAWRDRPEIFPVLLQLLEVRGADSWYGRDDFLQAAGLLAGNHTELRSAMVDYLQKQFADLSASPDGVGDLFDVIWRQDFRELRPALEKIATASEDEFEDPRATGRSDPPSPVTGRFHGARKILTTWAESDPLTKLKLDAIFEASSHHLFGIAELPRTQFDALSDDDQMAFREFVEWMGQQKVKYDWMPDKLEEQFAPTSR